MEVVHLQPALPARLRCVDGLPLRVVAAVRLLQALGTAQRRPRVARNLRAAAA